MTQPMTPVDTDALWHWLAETGPDALLLVDEEGRIVYANTHAHAVFGYAQGALQKLRVEALIPADLRGRHQAHRRAYTADPSLREMGNRSMALTGLRSDGTRFPAEIRLAPLRSAAGTWTAASIRDATEHQRITSELAAARALADRANEGKSRFLAAVSHDLRQPLQTLQVVSATLRRQKHDAATLGALEFQEQAVRAMSDLVHAVLNVSKLESGTVEPEIREFQVAEVLEDCGQFPELARAKGLALRIAESRLRVRTDRALLRELLANLISNAIKYTDAGQVVVRCRPSGAQFVEVEVQDTGLGIPASAMDSIFEDFMQVERPGDAGRGGVGLGLGTVRRIASLLGLRVSVRSAPGVGSTFSVEVPAGQEQAESAGTTAAVPPADTSPFRPAAATRVLFVEDDEAVRNATLLYLKLDGYEVQGAGSIREVQRFLDEGMQAPAIVVSDFQLGHGSRGTDAIRLVRDWFGLQIPAIILTGDTTLVSRAAAETSATVLLNKPVSAELLAARMAELIREPPEP